MAYRIIGILILLMVLFAPLLLHLLSKTEKYRKISAPLIVIDYNTSRIICRHPQSNDELVVDFQDCCFSLNYKFLGRQKLCTDELYEEKFTRYCSVEETINVNGIVVSSSQLRNHDYYKLKNEIKQISSAFNAKLIERN